MLVKRECPRFDVLTIPNSTFQFHLNLTLWLSEWSLGCYKALNFWFYGRNPKVRPFIGKLLSCTLLWCCLIFKSVCNFGNSMNFRLANVSSKRVKYWQQTAVKRLRVRRIEKLPLSVVLTFSEKMQRRGHKKGFLHWARWTARAS